jgi:putative ABC transport system permease protein
MHTFMSILGLAIGVAALVGVLSLGDGMETFAREQIESTTDLNMITIGARTTDTIDGLRVQRTDVVSLSAGDAASLRAEVAGIADVVYAVREAVRVGVPDDTLAAATLLLMADEGAVGMMPGDLLHGRWMTSEEFHSGAPLTVLNASFAKRLLPGHDLAGLPGRTLLVNNVAVGIAGLVDAPDGVPVGLVVPYALDGILSGGSLPSIAVKVGAVERVPEVRTTIERWASRHYEQGSEAIVMQSNEFRVEQAQRGVRLFKIIMGLITGISVLVGGVGIMNVMLMAVTDRTQEIGVRKATGARRKDIVFQFMIESVAISGFGAVVGLFFGLAGVLAATPIIRNFADAPFTASFTIESFLVIVAIAAMVGILFGTYPAYRAARMNPVDAIRRA